jgi:hypothetical protein
MTFFTPPHANRRRPSIAPHRPCFAVGRHSQPVDKQGRRCWRMASPARANASSGSNRQGAGGKLHVKARMWGNAYSRTHGEIAR